MDTIAGTAIASVVGAQLFNYNRGNFRYDSQLRFERFQSQREYAIMQTNQYRNDIRKLTELTVKKMSSYHMTGCLIIAVNIALFCAGRLGLHGASPPGWIMGLFLTNNAASLAFLATAVWLALHASQRASAASAHLLTRKVRVPVPTKKQLDMTRKLSSDFEHQSWGDIFRVPYMMGGAETVPDLEVDDHRTNQGSRRRSRSAPSGRAEKGGPAWYREEWDQDKRLKSTDAGIHQAPDHFKLYAACQKDWYQQECWARVCLFYGVLHFLHALAYYGLGHIFVELRSIWTAWATAGMLMVGHALLMSFDIRPHMKDGEMLPNFEYIGSLAVIPAALGMSLEFRVSFDATAVNVAWIVILLAYFMQIIYVLRLLEIVGPDRQYSVTESIGGAWWPRSWQFPSAFQHVMFLVAPPDHLKPGQVDLLRETLEGTDGTTGDQASEMRGVDNEQAVSMLSEWLEHYFAWWFETITAASDYVSQEGRDEVQALERDFKSAKNVRDAGRLRGIATQLKDAIYNHTNNVIAPPEMAAGGSGGGGGPDFDYDPNASAPLYSRVKMVEPWRLASNILIAILVAWSIMVVGVIIEAFMGEQVFLTAPHWARPPMTRPSRDTWELGAPLGGNDPAGYRDWLPENMEFYMEEKCKSGDEAAALGMAPVDHSSNDRFQNGDSCNNQWRRLQHQHRRLWGSRKEHTPPKHLAPPTKREALLGSLTDLLATLPSLDAASGLLGRDPTQDEAEALHSALAEFTPSKRSRPGLASAKLAVPRFTPVARDTRWPGFFDPRILACGPQAEGSKVAVITPRGVGAAVSVGEDGAPAAETFVLAGLANLPPVIGASWATDGLLLTTSKGNVVSCPGSQPQTGGRWTCATLEGAAGAMPMAEGGVLLSGAAAWMEVSGEKQLFVAVVTEAQPDIVGIFVLEGSGSDASWLPFGDITPPREGGRAGKVSISFVGATDILVATEDGAMLQRRLSDGSLVASMPASAPWKTAIDASSTPSTVWWQGVCAAVSDAGTDFVRLSLQQSAARTWTPDLGLLHLTSGNVTV